MCEPIALVAVSTALSLTSQQYNAGQQSKYAQAQLEAEAQAEANQQALAERQAQMEIQKGITEQEKYLRKARAQQAQNASMIAAGGFEMDSGTNLSMLQDQAEEIQHEANTITQNAEIASWQQMVNASNADSQQSMLRAKKYNSKVDRLGLDMSMSKSLLSGLSRFSNEYDT